jgi:hypothetical protein
MFPVRSSLLHCLLYSFALKMEAIFYSETFRFFSDCMNLNQNCCTGKSNLFQRSRQETNASEIRSAVSITRNRNRQAQSGTSCRRCYHSTWCKWTLNCEYVRMASAGMLCLVTLVRTDVSEELSASFIMVPRIGELGTTLAVTSNRRTLFLVHRFLSPWWRRRWVPPKRQFLQEPHGVTSQKTPFFINHRVCYINLRFYNVGMAVPRYKPEGCELETRWDEGLLSIYLFLHAAPGFTQPLTEMSIRDRIKKYFWRVERGRFMRLRSSPPCEAIVYIM